MPPTSAMKFPFVAGRPSSAPTGSGCRIRPRPGRHGGNRPAGLPGGAGPRSIILNLFSIDLIHCASPCGCWRHHGTAPSAPSSTSRRTPSATWSGTRRRGRRGHRPRARLGPPLRHRGYRLRRRLLAAAGEEGVAIRWVLETHAHADHLTAAPISRRGPARPSASASTSRTCSASSAGSSTRRTSSPKAATSTPVPRWRTLPPRPAHGGVLHVRAIPRRQSPTGSGGRLVATRCSCTTTARRGRFPAAMPMRSSLHPAPAGPAAETRCGCATTTRPPPRQLRPGRHGRRAARAQPPCEGWRDRGGFRAFRTARDATLAAPTLLLPRSR